jgi:hypothetical protein
VAALSNHRTLTTDRSQSLMAGIED